MIMDTVIDDRYDSRIERQAGMVVREEPVVYNEGTYADALSAEQLSAYQDKGFLVLEELFSPQEVKKLLAEVKALGERDDLQNRPELVTEPDSQELRSLFSVHQFSAMFERLMQDPRLRSEERRVGKECRHGDGECGAGRQSRGTV